MATETSLVIKRFCSANSMVIYPLGFHIYSDIYQTQTWESSSVDHEYSLKLPCSALVVFLDSLSFWSKEKSDLLVLLKEQQH